VSSSALTSSLVLAAIRERWALHASSSWGVARPRRRIVRSRLDSLSNDRSRVSTLPVPLSDALDGVLVPDDLPGGVFSVDVAMGRLPDVSSRCGCRLGRDARKIRERPADGEGAEPPAPLMGSMMGRDRLSTTLFSPRARESS